MKSIVLFASVLMCASLGPIVLATQRANVSNDPSTNDQQRTLSRKVGFGANGHPLNHGTYSSMPLEQQLSVVRTLKLGSYRVNVNPSYPENFARLSQLVDLAAGMNIRILPVIVLPASQYPNESTAYEDARMKVRGLANQFRTRIRVWELGNEYDLYCVKYNVDGSSPADYDPGKYVVVRGLIRGMRDALDEASTSAQKIVQTSQHTPTSLDSGFLQKLIQDGITFDITGYHYYSSSGQIPTGKGGINSLQVLHEFHKPIWITEFDKSAISPTVGPSAYPEQQAAALRVALNEIASRADEYDVIGADIYELLDQPELLTNPSVKPCQAQFGILASRGEFTAASRAVQNFLRIY